MSPNLKKMETWKMIEGFEEKYDISSLGRVRNYQTARILAQKTDKVGYRIVSLHNSGATKFVSVHRLVAGAFIPNPNEYPEVNHINGIKSDNRVSNLEWCTSAMNKQHALKIGLRKGSPTNKPVIVELPGEKPMWFMTIKDAAEYYGCDRKAIKRRLEGKNFAFLRRFKDGIKVSYASVKDTAGD